MVFRPFESLGTVVRYIGLASALVLAGCTTPNLDHLLGVDGGADSSETPDGRKPGKKDLGRSPGGDMPTPYQDGPGLPLDLGRILDVGADTPRPDAPPDASPDIPDAGRDAIAADARRATPDRTPPPDLAPTPDLPRDVLRADLSADLYSPNDASVTPDRVSPTADLAPAPDTAGDSYSGIPFLEDLIAMWLFDEELGSGSAITDSSGNGYSGTVESATRVAGRRGNALDLNGGDARVDIVGFPAFRAGSSLTFSVWYQAQSYDSGAGGGNTLAHLGRFTGDYNLVIRFNLGRLQFLFLNESLSSAGVWQSDEPYAAPDPDAWHKLDIAFTYGDASSFRAYRDGTPIAGSWGGTDGSAAPYVPSETFLTIGAYRQGGSYSQEFDGVMDDVRLYDRALSEGELLGLFNDEL